LAEERKGNIDAHGLRGRRSVHEDEKHGKKELHSGAAGVMEFPRKAYCYDLIRAKTNYKGATGLQTEERGS